MATTLSTPGPALALRMLGNETGKGLRVTWVQKAPLVLQTAYMVAFYWIIQLFVGGGRFVPELLAMTFVAYLAYIVGYIALLRMAGGVLEEMYTSTLEQTLLSPLRPWIASTGRLAAALAEGLITAAIVTGFYLVLFLSVDVVVGECLEFFGSGRQKFVGSFLVSVVRRVCVGDDRATVGQLVGSEQRREWREGQPAHVDDRDPAFGKARSRKHAHTRISQPPLSGAFALLGLAHHHQGERSDWLLARCDLHGKWIEWRSPDPITA